MRLRNKKGQLHLTETIAVLFIFFVLIVFGLIFYFKYQQYSLKEEQEQLVISNAIRTTSKVLFLPELQCSKGAAEPEDNCIDLMKVRHVAEVFDRHLTDYYYPIFGYSKIVINQIYPEQKEWVIYDHPKPIYANETIIPLESTYFTLTLKDESLGGENIHYSFGYIQVGVYP